MGENIDTKAAHVAVLATTRYFYNVAPAEQVAAYLGQSLDNLHPNYVAEKVQDYRAGFATFFGVMDCYAQRRYVKAALERYSAEVADEIDFNRRYFDGQEG